MNNFALETFLNDYLQVARIKDYCPNGLQVQGREEIRTVVTGVTANLDLIRQAVERKADAIMVHHGIFWKGDEQPVRGMLYQRLKLLMQHEINLYAYHLPLDMHSEVGNNVLLGRALGIEQRGWCTEDEFPLVGFGVLSQPQSAGSFMAMVDQKIHHQSFLIGDPDAQVERIAWCSGAAGEFLPQACAKGAQLYITGEVPERVVHQANELGISVLVAGHHCTEILGIKTLGELIQKKFSINVEFIDVHNNL